MRTSYLLGVAACTFFIGGILVGTGPASFTAQVSGSLGRAHRVSADIPRAALIGKDRKPVVVGITFKGSRQAWAIARYRADGSLDPSFGRGGRIATDFGTDATSLAVEPGGKLLVAGAGIVGKHGDSGFVLARFTAHGQFDPTFGTHGVVRTAFARINGETSSVTRVVSVAVARDGEIVAIGFRGGVNTRGLVLARYTRSGRLDPSFGHGGRVVTASGPPQPAAAALQPDGKIVVLGGLFLPDRPVSVIARFTTRGELDPSFGDGGQVLIERGALFAATAIVVQPDGKIVVGGAADQARSGLFAVLRYMPDGKLDRSFGKDGEVRTEVDPGHPCTENEEPCLAELVISIGFAPGGALVAVGQPRHLGVALTRYTAGGKLDASFGSGGIVLGELGWGGNLHADSSESDGSIVVVGSRGGHFAVARYTRRGGLDSSFGTDGQVATLFGPLWQTKLIAMSARRIGARVIVRWRTASELDADRFYVTRETRTGSVRIKRILPKGPGGGGASYSLTDRGAPQSVARYGLVEITVDRNVRQLGEAKVRP